MSFRILLAHNRYIYRGGEDSVVDDELALLQSRGHAVRLFLEDNRHLREQNSAAIALGTVWSSRALRKLKIAIDEFRPDVIHVHNFFPQISPAVFWEASSFGIPSVLTLHNFRYACAQGMFLREGRVCEACAGRFGLRGIVNRCYRDSLTQSLMLVGSFSFHKLIGTFCRKISLFIALTDFCRNKFIECGLPPDKVIVKPNFVDIPFVDCGKKRSGGLFVGRLSPEKGIAELTEALGYTNTRLKVIGDGPLSNSVRNCPQFEFLGWQNSDQVYQAMHLARYLVMPSIGMRLLGVR
jgi:glycosyltransferase involved in cell wall biosynthesis